MNDDSELREDPTPKLKAVSERIKELGDKSSQTLLFLSFAIVVVILRQGGESGQQSLGPAQSCALYAALWSWVLAIFPVALCIAPLKEHRWNDLLWYEKVRRFKVVMLRIAILLVVFGTIAFAYSISGRTARRPMHPSEGGSVSATVPIPPGATIGPRIGYDVFDCVVSEQQRQFCLTHDVPGLNKMLLGGFVLRNTLPEPPAKVDQNPNAEACINADGIVNYCQEHHLMDERLKVK